MLRLSEGCVALAEGCVDVGALERRQKLGTDRGLQPLRRGGIVSGARLRQADRDACAERRGRVTGCDRVVEDLVDNPPGLLGVFRQPKLELRIGEPELALVDIAKVGSRLQVLHGNAELSSQLPERLDRRTARTRLDSRDVGV